MSIDLNSYGQVEEVGRLVLDGLAKVSNREFLETMVPVLPEGACIPVASNNDLSNWTPKSWAHGQELVIREGWNGYCCLASHRRGNPQPRTKESFLALHWVMLDDIGPKVPRDQIRLAPTCEIETSSGNSQLLYLLKTPLTDLDLVDRIGRAITRAKLSDPGAGGLATRYGRLPQCSNTKYNPHFECQLRAFNPELSYTVQELVDGLGLELDPPKAKPEPRQPDPKTMGLEDQVLIDRARAAANGAKFDALMRGDLSEHGDDHSAADAALCALLAFWTRDPAQIDRIFRSSGLMRPKWDERHGRDTYGNITIQKALELVPEPGESDWNREDGQTAGKNAAHEARAQECKDGIFNGADLLEMDLPEIVFAVVGLLPMGLAILAGGPKLGKSWLIYCICAALGAGRRVLGHFRASQAKSLYLALEDSKRRLQDRLKALCNTDPAIKAGLSNVDFQITWPRFDDEGGLEKLEEYIKENVPSGLKLVVVDTLAKVMPKSKSKGLNAYENDSIIMSRIKSMADKYGVCILIVTHLSKLRTSKDPFDSITGSMGQFGTADTAMLLTRKRGAPNAILQTTGRDIEGNSYDLSWSNPGWSCIGLANEDELELSPERLAILRVFRDHDAPISSGMVAAETGKSLSNTSKLIKKLVEEGFLFPCGYGLYSVQSGQSIQSGKTIQSGQSPSCPSLNTLNDFPSGLIPDEVTI